MDKGIETKFQNIIKQIIHFSNKQIIIIMKTKITFMAFIISALCFTSSAQVATWTGPDAGDWSTAENWSTTSVPLIADSVSIPAGKVVTISENVGTINRLSVSGKLIISAAGALEIDQAISPNGSPIVTLAGGEIMNEGSFTVKNSVVTASNTVLQFAENADRDNLFTNNGSFTMDNTIGAYASTTGRGIGLNMVSPGRVSAFKMGGTMNINIKAGCCFIETNGGGNLTLDGTLVLGSDADYKNLRFIKIQAGGSVTVAPTANITLYTGFVSGNGVINMQSALTTEPGSIFTNFGTIAIHGGSATTGYGLYFNPQAANALNTFNNAGTITVDGTFPLGFMYIGGTATGTTTINNQSTGTIGLYHSDPAAQVIKTAGTGNTVTINNEGTLKVSSATITLSSTAAVINNTGTIIYNAIAGVKSLNALNGKMYKNANDLIVELQGNAQLIISDITGKNIRNQQLTDERNVINTNNLKGIYIVRIISEKGVYSQKVSL